MEITYRREPNASRMIVSGIKEGVFHEEKMIEENDIPSLLAFSKSNSDSGKELWFDISGRKSLKNYFAQEGINPNSIYEGIKAIQEGLEETEKYLISAESLIFTPETIFFKWENLRWKAAFAYAPGSNEEFSAGLLSIFEYLIRNVDHNSGDSVSVCYTLFEKVSKKDVTLSDIIADIEPLLMKSEENKDFVQTAIKDTFSQPEIEDSLERPPWFDDEEDIFETPLQRKGLFGFVFRGDKKPKEKSSKKKKEKEKGFWDEGEPEYFLEEISENGSVPFAGTTLLDSEAIYGRRLVYEGRGKHPDMQIEKTPFLIGSNKEGCDGVICESIISRAHAKIVKKDEDYYIEDLESKNGTFLNGQILDFNKQAKLSLGDAISFANIGYRFM